MNIKEYQNKSKTIVDKLDKKFNIKRTPQMSISQLLEELGELTEQVNKKNLRNTKPKKEDLEDEFADVFIQLGKLASEFNIDLKKAIKNKMKTLKERHKL